MEDQELTKKEMMEIARKDMRTEKLMSCLYAVAFAVNVGALAYAKFGWGSLFHIVIILWMVNCFKKTVKKQIVIDSFLRKEEEGAEA